MLSPNSVFVPTAKAGGIKFLVQVSASDHPSHSHEHNISGMPLGNFFKCHKRPLRLMDKLIRNRWSKVNGQGHCDLTKQCFRP